MTDLATLTDRLVSDLSDLALGPPVAYAYNPLEYARAPYDAYLRRYGAPPKEGVFVGMNPGPFGMAQTGVPFGDVHMVREVLGVEGPVGRPRHEHPDRPVLGFQIRRREASGTRLWSWVQRTFGAAEPFFDRFLVVNYCPLLLLTREGANLTPDKLRGPDRSALEAACDRALRATVEHLSARVVVGIGRFAESRSRAALVGLPVRIGSVPHPSPANPAANAGWGQLMDRGLSELGVAVP